MASVLNHAGWIRFNEEKWSLQSQRFSYGSMEGAGEWADIVVYKNSSGRIRSPERMPYHYLEFRPTSTPAPQRRERQWLDISSRLAGDLLRVGFGGAIAFDPAVSDLRAWQWHGYRTDVRYTYIVPLPYDIASASSAVRKNVKKAERDGYRCEQTDDVDAVVHCLRASEGRQRFSYNITVRDLARVTELMTDSFCRMYLCSSSSGDPASARVVLATPGSRAIDWLAGTRVDHLTRGVTQQLFSFVLGDLLGMGATDLDYGGANIPTIARAKAEWGGRLVPFYVVQPRSGRGLAIEGQAWLKARMLRRRAANDAPR